MKGRCRKRLGGGREECGQVCQNFWGPEPPLGGKEGVWGLAEVKSGLGGPTAAGSRVNLSP